MEDIKVPTKQEIRVFLPPIRETIFTPCRKYRYQLWRDWDMCNKTYVQFIGLNPSTANETENDPTVRRCIDFAKRWGYGGMFMTNLFAFISTDPQGVYEADEPVGTNNVDTLLTIGREAGHIICAWGAFGIAKQSGFALRTLFKSYRMNLHHLGLNGDGSPKHPLYLSKTIIPKIWANGDVPI